MREPFAQVDERQRILVGPHVTLSPFKEEDISDRYIGWVNDPEVNRFLNSRLVHQTRETVHAYVRSYYGEAEKYMWGILDHGSSAMVGTATLYNVDRHNGSAHFGIMIGEKAYWGKQASSEAIQLIAGWTFGTLGLRYLSAGSCAANHGINFTLKRLGFTLEGKLRKAKMLTPGTYVDGYWWGLLAEEWTARLQHRT